MSLKFWPSFMDNSNSLILINCVVCTRSGCFKSILAPETGLMFGFVKVLSKSSFLFSINLPEKEHKIQHHCHEDDKPFSFSSSQSAKKSAHIWSIYTFFFLLFFPQVTKFKCMSLDCGRKLGSPETTPQPWGHHANSPRGFKTQNVLLWSDGCFLK